MCAALTLNLHIKVKILSRQFKTHDMWECQIKSGLNLKLLVFSVQNATLVIDEGVSYFYLILSYLLIYLLIFTSFSRFSE